MQPLDNGSGSKITLTGIEQSQTQLSQFGSPGTGTGNGLSAAAEYWYFVINAHSKPSKTSLHKHAMGQLHALLDGGLPKRRFGAQLSSMQCHALISLKLSSGQDRI